MPFEIGDVVYSLQTLDDPPGETPGCHLCNFGDKLIVRKIGTHPTMHYGVSHEHRTDGNFFWVTGNEISYMKHFDHNKP